MQKVLITGGAGFIGSHLSNLLCSNGYSVRILDNLSPQIHGESAVAPEWLSSLGIDFRKGCITNKQDVEAALENVDVVVHLAAETGTGQSMYEIQKYNEVNSQGTAVLLDIIANAKSHNVARILLASSRSVYGEGAYVCSSCADGKRHSPNARTARTLAEGKWDPICDSCETPLTPVPTKETDAIKPASIYAATKFAQEHLISVFCESQGIGYGILRLQNVYGEGQSLNNPYTGILSIFSTRIRRGLVLPIFEDGKETRDFVHVSDVANSFLAAIQIEKAPNTLINVGTGELITVLDIATQLSESFGHPANTVVTGEYRIGDIRHNRADIDRLKTLLNYTPQVSIQEGLQAFVNWVEKQPLPEDKLDKANAELKAKKLMR